MAQRTIVQLEDDIDGGPADSTVTLAYNGVTYELDLSAKNVDKLTKALEPYTNAGRKVGGGRRSSAKASGGKTDKAQLQAMRQWLRDNGHDVSDRGRVSQELQNIYNAAH